MPKKQALLITNPKSRSGNMNIEQGIEYLEANDFTVEVVLPEKPDDIKTSIRQHRDRADLVIIGGGDGTLNCAASSLMDTGLPLGIIPLGTANDLARTLQIPINPMEALEVIAKGKRREIDVGCVNDILFFNASSIGLGVDVTRKLSQEIKSRWGLLSYAHSVWNALKANRSFSAKVVCDGKLKRMRSIQITVGNGRFYGGGMVIAEDAEIDDLRLDLYSLKPQKLWRLLSLAPAIRMGHLDNKPSIVALHGQSIEIYTRKRKSVSTDGELTTHTPAHYRVIPKAVNVFVP